MVIDGVHDDLVAVQAAQTHGLGGMAVIGVEGGVQLRYGAAVAVHVQELDALGRVLVGQDGHQHGGESIEAAHLAGVQVLALLALRPECLLEGPVGVDGVGAEHGHIGVQHGHRGAQARHHGGILVVADLREVQQFQLNGLAGGLQAVQHAQALGQRSAAAGTQQSGSVQNLNDVLFVQLSHVRSSLNHV